MSELTISYQIAFEHSEMIGVSVRLSADTLALIPESSATPPPWTTLTYKRCVICELDARAHSVCPIAANLVHLIELFGRRFSYDDEITRSEKCSRDVD
jgi:hypothetical protein